ncbi:protein NRT1/ PTR FAMILY 4.3-like [Iris pallida]|uniref:Protein NRT1/ PTR FAMILY 4.3-like n=1 Tax=Iris pallida TaxID=29817 RepID=A0AAX6I2J6_IRIPA|nr:protein NRT1/ PTR FAMILY 4.3-like [Iris pallida]
MITILQYSFSNGGSVSPVLVPPGAQNIHPKVDTAQRSEEPVEEVQPVLVEVQPVQPPLPVAPQLRRHGVDHLHEYGAEEVAEGEGEEGEGGGQRAHARGRLRVEELRQAHEGEHVGHAEDAVLEGEPEEAYLLPGVAVERVPPLDLDRGGDGHGHDGEHEADRDPLELGDARGVAGEAAGEGDEGELVDGEEEGHEEEGDDGDGGGRDGEGAELAVHDAPLLHREGLQLGDAGVHEDGAGEDGEHPDQDLHLLHLCHGADLPWVRRASFGEDYRSFVQEPDFIASLSFFFFLRLAKQSRMI